MIKKTLLIDIQEGLIRRNYDDLGVRFIDLIKERADKERFVLNEILDSPGLLDVINEDIDIDGMEEELDRVLMSLGKLLFVKFELHEFKKLLRSLFVDIIPKKLDTQKELFFILNPVTYSDFHYLRMHNDPLYVYWTEDKLERILVSAYCEDLLDLTLLKFSFKGIETALLKQEPSNLFVVSSRLSFMQKEVINKLPWLDKFNYKTNFILHYNLLATNIENITEDTLSVELGVENYLMSLIHLFSKLKLMAFIKNNPSKEKGLIRVGINFDLNTTYNIVKKKVLEDDFPLTYSSFDCLYPRKNQKIDIYYGRPHASLQQHQIKDKELYEKCLDITAENIKKLKNKNGGEVVCINNVQQIRIFLYRKAMAELTSELLAMDSFQKQLHNEFPGITFRFPKTVFLNHYDADKALKQVEEQGLTFPVLVKADACVSSLSKYGHHIIIVKTKQALKQLISEKKCSIE